ncbi:MAG: FliA/WhiG family RNA polymerase sigma factor [Gemmatimonadota bacterium]
MAPATEVLWQRYRKHGDADARAELLTQHLGLVHHTARQIAARVGDALAYEDMVGAGTLGLVQALEAFDPERGFAFATFATQRIRGSILDELRAADWRPRSVRTKGRQVSTATTALERKLGRRPRPEEVAHELQIDLATYWRWRNDAETGVTVALDTAPAGGEGGRPSLAELLADDNSPAPDAGIARDERRTLVREAIASLPEQQRTVLALYYYEELTLRQIAEVLHVTESRISQVRTAALRTLREYMTAEAAA